MIDEPERKMVKLIPDEPIISGAADLQMDVL
jgi:hypothetical protein